MTGIVCFLNSDNRFLIASSLSSILTKSLPPHLSPCFCFLNSPSQGINLPHFLHCLLFVKRIMVSFYVICRKITFTSFCHSYQSKASLKNIASSNFLGLPSESNPLKFLFCLNSSNLSIHNLEITNSGTHSPLFMTFTNFSPVKSPFF